MENADTRPAPRRSVYILPNLITTASLFSGFLALLYAARGEFEHCAVAIFVSAIMDGLDGKVARLTRTSSEFGVQYDSLCDLVAFGVAPAFLIYQWQISRFGSFGTAIAFLYAVCGALRLARFNITPTANKKFFIGLPIPAGGCAIAALVFFVPYLPGWLLGALPYLSLVYAFLLGALMVSRVRYLSFKEYGFIRAYPFRSMVSAILLFVLIVANPTFMGFLLFAAYLISGPVYTFFFLPRRASLAVRKASEG